MRDDDTTKTPMTNDELRRVLASPAFARASPTLDRVQDAFERLLRERTGLQHELAVAERRARDLTRRLVLVESRSFAISLGSFVLGAAVALVINGGW